MHKIEHGYETIKKTRIDGVPGPGAAVDPVGRRPCRCLIWDRRDRPRRRVDCATEAAGHHGLDNGRFLCTHFPGQHLAVCQSDRCIQPRHRSGARDPAAVPAAARDLGFVVHWRMASMARKQRIGLEIRFPRGVRWPLTPVTKVKYSTLGD